MFGLSSFSYPNISALDCLERNLQLMSGLLCFLLLKAVSKEPLSKFFKDEYTNHMAII